jgi:uncharacterized protein
MEAQRRQSKTVLALVFLMALAMQPLQAQEPFKPADHYNKHEYQIPMRDGVRLFTAVYVPKDDSQSYPIMLTRTPYSVAPYGADAYRSLGPHEGFARDGFIFVYQDVRGQFMSEGEFVHVRPHRAQKQGPADIDESTDTYDTVEWLIRNIPNNNGRVGIYGISYPGFYTAAGIIDTHPAIKAASPQAPVGDWFVGDDFHHHGAFFLQDAFNFMWSMGRARTELTKAFHPRFEYPTQDAYRFFLEMGPLAQADEKYLKGEVPFWNEMMEHGRYDEFWQHRNIIPHLKNVRTAVMTVAGWFDAEDPYGPLEIYHSIEKNNPGISNILVVGPWSHGGWARSDGDALGNVRFHVKTGRDYREKIDLSFFRHHLKGEGELELPEALVFITGTNAWRSFEAWPPPAAGRKSLYLQPAEALSFEPPSDTSPEAFDAYPSDPDKPVPYTSEIRITRSIEYMVEDQRFASRRPDVLVYQSEELSSDVTVVGPVTTDLYVSSTATDADFVVKLIDVYPEDFPEIEPEEEKYLNVPMGGYQMLVRGEVMRARFRNSYENPEALVPAEVSRVRFRMPDIAHTFKRGHRIMVQIQSSWFPLVDRNPQKFVDIYRAAEEDFQKATHRIHRSAEFPSRLEVNLLEP